MSRFRRVVSTAVVLPVMASPIVATSAQAASIPNPPSKKLPAALDAAAKYDPQTTCDPDPKPGVVAMARLLAEHYDEWNYGISRHCNAGVTEHSEGRALDWMLSAYDPRERAIADSVVEWLTKPDSQGRPGAMAARFGIMYIIWNNKMWRAYAPERGWAPYSGVSPHTDHIHFSYSWDGAYGRTSWWTGKALGSNTSGSGKVPAATPTPARYPTLRVGATGSDVRILQKGLGVGVDGMFGPATEAAVRAYQKAHRINVSGAVSAVTWNALIDEGKVPARSEMNGTNGLSKYAGTTLRLGSRGEAVKAVQRALKITADGMFGPATEAAVREYQRTKKLTVNGIVTNEVWDALLGRRSSGTASRTPTPTEKPAGTAVSATTAFTRYKGTVLRRGSRGDAVRLVQRTIGVPADGAFGPATESALRTWQGKRGLTTDAVVHRADWNALEKWAHPLIARRATVLRVGSTGNSVKDIQRALRISADGIYGSGTAAAVKALQGRHRLARTGTVGALTWAAAEKEIVARR
ncbi:peptidoglycan-binding domain-containing protein [Kribbia dieselivorans]|uniref:peptidoglycan-binding domain-containing protein n=1 Tax=Kribbia dieselivorans TaxID=331526 RepID=UPI0008390285|nr:peptidoglycan-binding protein [Kribbia dieselivorans]